ncbi:MAG: hypothetical protein J1F38_03590 [Muribaculaceae bacterium]|nr:hypothetical protein [Muribaculaceae bacterium]
MDGKFFDIPFRLKSSDSDFICKDGEIASAINLGYEGEIEGDSLSISGIAGAGVDLPPAPDIDFAIIRDVLKGWHAVPDDFPKQTIIATDPSLEYWTKMASQFLSQFQSEGSVNSLFIAPFYVMGTWKTIGGSYLSASEPVIMVPNSSVPLVATDDNLTATELEFRVAAAVCSLYFRMRAPEVLRKWVGKIESLEILVSDPLQKYDSYSAFLPRKRVTTSNFCRALDLTTGEVKETKVCTMTLPVAWQANLKGVGEENLDSWINADLKFYPFATIPLGEIDRAGEWGAAGMRGIGDRLYGGKSTGVDLKELKGEGIGETSKSAALIYLRGEDSNFTLKTRPIKLTGAGALKSSRRLYLRGEYRPENIGISVYASRDMLHWWLVSQKRGSTVVSLPKASFRFYRIELEGYLSATETLQGITIS